MVRQFSVHAACGNIVWEEGTRVLGGDSACSSCWKVEDGIRLLGRKCSARHVILHPITKVGTWLNPQETFNVPVGIELLLVR